MTASRRGFLLTGAMGVATAAGLTAVSAPAMAADSPWSDAFIVADESAAYDGSFHVDKMYDVQVANAKFIMAVGKAHQVPRFGIEIALATAIQESKLTNIYTQLDHDSAGLFQQRPEAFWGTLAQVRNKLLSTRAFYGVKGAEHTNNNGLIQLRGWENMKLTDAAAEVQRPRADLRGAYQQWADDAADIYNTWGNDVAPFDG